MKKNMAMFRYLLTFLLLVLAFRAFAQKTIPAVDLRTLDGRPANIGEYLDDDQPVILSFWASWCKPCHRELNAFHDLYGQWQERFGVQILAVTIDTRRQLARAKSIAATEGWEFVLLSDQDNRLKNALNVQAIPQTYLINKAGEIIYESNGYVPGAERQLEQKLMEISKK